MFRASRPTRGTPPACRSVANDRSSGYCWCMTMTAADVEAISRSKRQELVTDWCGRAFGVESQQDRQKRVLRFLEEAMELFQAEGGEQGRAEALLQRVYSRPAGEVGQEVGGVCVTLLSYCSAAHLSLEECEAAEIARVLDKPVEEAQRRYDLKTKAGF